MQRSQESRKEKKRKANGSDDDDSRFSNALQPASSARGRLAPQDESSLLERGDDDSKISKALQPESGATVSDNLLGTQIVIFNQLLFTAPNAET